MLHAWKASISQNIFFPAVQNNVSTVFYFPSSSSDFPLTALCDLLQLRLQARFTRPIRGTLNLLLKVETLRL